jgi:hypothetical protein
MIYIACLYVLLIFLPVIGLSFLYIYLVVYLRRHYNAFRETSVTLAKLDSSNTHTKNSQKRQSQMRIHYKTAYRSNKTNSLAMSTNVSSRCLISLAWRRDVSRESTRSNREDRKRREEKAPKRRADSSLPAVRDMTNQSSVSSAHKPLIRSFSSQPLNESPSQKWRVSVASNTAQTALTKKINHTVMISMVALAFFFCQLPLRIFLLWSYNTSANLPPIEPFASNQTDSVVDSTSVNGEMSVLSPTESINQDSIFYINLWGHISTIVYFLHCVSNPIIYNLISIKFRRAFLNLSRFQKNSACTNKNLGI